MNAQSERSQGLKLVLAALIAILCLALWTVAGCGGAGEEEGAETGGNDAGNLDNGVPDAGSLGYRPCTAATKVGGFRIDLGKGYTGVQGQVFDGVVPTNVSEVVETSGECKLLRKRTLLCNPRCVPGKTCDDKGVCIPTPTGVNVGKVTITGLKAPISMEPRAPIYYYTNSGTLPHPAFEPGAAIRLSATGGDYSPFVLLGEGIDALEVTAKEIPVDRGKATVIAWKPPTVKGKAKVHINLNIANHGGTPVRIECEVDDTGSFSIPEALVTKLVDFGFSGFPTVNLTRRTADSTTLAPGCVELVVTSEVSIPVALAGVVSCTTDKDCPAGKTCQADLTCK